MKDRIALAIAIIAFLVLAYTIGDSGSPVAAKSAEPVTQCELVATTGKIDIFLCEPDGVAPFLQNSYGFMRDVE